MPGTTGEHERLPAALERDFRAGVPWFRALKIHDNFVVRGLVIDLKPAPGSSFRHLVLTGRNGSGKTSTLRGIEAVFGQPALIHPPDRGRSGEEPGSNEYKRNFEYLPAPRPAVFDRAEGGVSTIRLLASFGPRRAPTFNVPPGPTRELGVVGTAELEQTLLNWRTFGKLAESPEAEARYLGRLRDFEDALRGLVAPVSCSLEFVSDELRYYVNINGVRASFSALPDGFQAVLDLWAHTWAAVQRASATEGQDVAGVVLIDEPELHLHLAMQERILPFLARAFPRVQLIVATHSAAIAASLEHAVIYDLSQQRGITSEDLYGWRYGRVMTDLLGLDDEYSVAVTDELRELERLRDLATRTTAEQAELRALADRLVASSHVLALEVWLRLRQEDHSG